MSEEHEAERVLITRKQFYTAAWTLAITVLLAFGSGALTVTYAVGGWSLKIEAHEKRITNLEEAQNNTQRVLDRIEFNLKNDIERRGGRYTELP